MQLSRCADFGDGFGFRETPAVKLQELAAPYAKKVMYRTPSNGFKHLGLAKGLSS